MPVQIKQEQAYAYAELLEIMGYMENAYINKIPKKLMMVFKENASSTYEKHIDISKPLKEQNISQKTEALIGMLTLQYWCESESEKQELISIFKENEKDLKKEYNLDNVFKKNELDNNKIENNIDETLNEIDSIDKISEIESKKAEQRAKERALIAESRAKMESSKAEDGILIDYKNLVWYKKMFIKFKKSIYNIFKSLKNK